VLLFVDRVEMDDGSEAMTSFLRRIKPLKIGAALIVWLLASSTLMAEAEQTVPFSRLEARYCSGGPSKIMRTIRNQQELKSLLGRSRVKLPVVDFSKNMLILISMGRQPSSGYQTRITNLAENGKTLKVQIEETSPGGSCLASDVETYPCDLVLTKKINKRLVFEVDRRTKDCQ
jgi:protease stability complex PrcB-like protein